MVAPIFPAIVFEWDDGNREKNYQKHNVTIEECEAVFFNKPLTIFDDLLHSKNEERWYAMGRTKSGRCLAVVFTMRKNRIRIISARDMDKHERNLYEKT
ncbi:MAG: BrnT family toxin [Patescibacteria group bacterium]